MTLPLSLLKPGMILAGWWPWLIKEVGQPGEDEDDPRGWISGFDLNDPYDGTVYRHVEADEEFEVESEMGDPKWVEAVTMVTKKRLRALRDAQHDVAWLVHLKHEVAGPNGGSDV